VFLVQRKDVFELTWFTPVTEVALCGHATLASAYVLFELRKWPEEEIIFQTRQSGRLVVEEQDGRFEMDFPARLPKPIKPPKGLTKALGIEMPGVKPIEVLGSKEDMFAVLPDEASVRSLKPNIEALSELDCRGLCVTAKGDKVDFVSRFFAPAVGVAEDPVTGSTHCVLTPYWAKVLGKKDLHAYQVSKRGGELFCRNRGERVRIAGSATLYLEGTISV
jgi:PhzF family phenazine biosynthesis protein